MKKEELLYLIAKEAYNVGYGAKLNFASYDILTKYPELNSIVSISVGVLGLAFSFFSSKYISIVIIIMGVIGLLYDKNSLEHLENYDKCGKEATILFKQLHQLYLDVEAFDDDNLTVYKQKLNEISSNFVQLSFSKQVLFSTTLAHQKFFYEMDIEWVDAELHFSFWKDKMPSKLKWIIFFLIAFVGSFVIYKMVR